MSVHRQRSEALSRRSRQNLASNLNQILGKDIQNELDDCREREAKRRRERLVIVQSRIVNTMNLHDNSPLTKESVLNEIYQLEDMVSSLESDVHVSGKIISILTQVTQLIARIDTESLSDEQIMRVLNAIGYEERSWIEHVRKHMAISQ